MRRARGKKQAEKEQTCWRDSKQVFVSGIVLDDQIVVAEIKQNSKLCIRCIENLIEGADPCKMMVETSSTF